MAWRVRRRNQNTGASQVSPTTYPNAAAAFDAAWDNLGAFIKDNIRQAHVGDDENPPSLDNQMKVRIITKDSLPPPLKGVLELRYDYQVSPGNWETNSIYYEIANL